MRHVDRDANGHFVKSNEPKAKRKSQARPGEAKDRPYAMSYREIGKKLSMSEKDAQKLERSALLKIRKALGLTETGALK
jgi:hypothetical protein